MPKVTSEVGPLFRHLGSDFDAPAKGVDRFDQVVGGHDQHRRITVLTGNQTCAEPDAGRRIATTRLADDLPTREALKLPGGFFAMGVGGNDPDSLRRDERFDSVQSKLQESSLASEGEKLLRALLPTARPESRPASAGHDYRVQHGMSRELAGPTKFVAPRVRHPHAEREDYTPKYVGPVMRRPCVTFVASSSASRA